MSGAATVVRTTAMRTALKRSGVSSPRPRPSVTTTIPTSPRGAIPTPTARALQRPAPRAPISPARTLVAIPRAARTTALRARRGSAQGPEVQLGAGHGEEERRDDRRERLDLVLDLVLRLCLGDDQPGHEGADDRREADQGGQDREREHHQEDGHDRRVGKERPGEHLAAHAARPAGDGEPEDHEPDRADDQAERGQPEVALGRPRDDPDEDERENVVDDGRPDDDPAETPVEDAEVGEDAARDPDAGGGQGEADERGCRRRLPGDHREGHTGRDREDHAQHGRDDGGPADLEQLVGLDLQADREEQDDDADLREDRRGLARRDEAERIRADHEPAGQLADHARLAEPPEDLLANLRRQEEDEEPHDHVERLGGARGRRREGQGARRVQRQEKRAHRSGKVAHPEVDGRDQEREQGHQAAHPQELPEADGGAGAGDRARSRRRWRTPR